MEPKVSVLQANAQLAQKVECWAWNHRLVRGLGYILTGGNIFTDFFLFSHREASDANIGIIANFVQFVKNSIEEKSSKDTFV